MQLRHIETFFGELFMFSFLISCYAKDRPLFLKAAFDSIFAQTLLPEEIILVVDGPINPDLDRIVDEAKRVALSAGIRFVEERLTKNVGLGLALNAGLRLCTEDYVVRMDSDDVCRPFRLECMAQAVRTYSDVSVFGTFIEEFIQFPGDLGQIRGVPRSHASISRSRAYRCPMNHVTVCMKREALVEAGGYCDVPSFEDYFLWLKMLKMGFIFLNSSIVTVDVRVNDLMSRRVGLSYMGSELDFYLRALRAGYLSIYEVALFLPLRLSARFAALLFGPTIYRMLRTSGSGNVE